MTYLYEIRSIRSGWSVLQSVWSTVIQPILRTGRPVYVRISDEGEQ